MKEVRDEVARTSVQSRDRACIGTQFAVERVWGELEKAAFVVISYVTPAGKPCAGRVVQTAAGRHPYVVTAPDSRNARRISNGNEVAVTVPIRRLGMLSLVTRITSIQRAVSLPDSPWQEALERGSP